MIDRRPVTPPSEAVRRARKQLSPKPQTPRFDPAVHRAPTPKMAEQEKDDSFVAVIESRSPAKIMHNEPGFVETTSKAQEPVAANPGPIVLPSIVPIRPISMRSPPIEDSVREIDDLEEALDKINVSLPTGADEPDSLETQKEVNAAKSSSTATTKGDSEVEVGTVVKRAPGAKPATKNKKNTARPTAKSSKPVVSQTTSRATTRRPAVSSGTFDPPAAKAATTRAVNKTGMAARRPSIAAKTLPLRPKATSPTAGKAQPVARPRPSMAAPGSVRKASAPAAPASAATRPKPRVSSVTKAPFVPAKSSKAPTTSTFTLPGEAISARLKTQREERRKQEEATEKARREFKARPVRRSSVSGAGAAGAGSVRATAASRARMSVAHPVAAAEKDRPTTTMDGIARKASADPAATPTRTANTKAIRTPPSAKAKAAVLPTVRTKAVPVKTELQQRREKEEAARKARTEAAERGRAASRAWAEKMQQRKAAKQVGGVNGPVATEAAAPTTEEKQAVMEPSA